MRYTGWCPVNPEIIVNHTTLDLGMDLRLLVWMFYRVRQWKYSGTIHAVGSPDPPFTLGGTFTPRLSANEKDQYDIPESYDRSDGNFSFSPNTAGAHIVLPTDVCGQNGTDPIASWSIPFPIIQVVYADSVGNTCEAGNSGIAGGSPTAFSMEITGTDLISGLTYHFAPPILSSQGFGSFVDCVGSLTFEPALYWAFEDDNHVPLYDTTTGARL